MTSAGGVIAGSRSFVINVLAKVEQNAGNFKRGRSNQPKSGTGLGAELTKVMAESYLQSPREVVPIPGCMLEPLGML